MCKFLTGVFLLILANVISRCCLAGDWLCTQEASQRRGDSILACGIGIGRDENSARSAAFENAKAEFMRLCNLSEDCRWHKFNVTPSRTDCEEKDGLISCQRLLSFEIQQSTGVQIASNVPMHSFASTQPPRAKAWTCHLGGLGI